MLTFAVGLKQPEALAARATPDSLQSLSAEALRYEKARIVGGESVRLAIASHIASRRNDAIISLYDSEPAVREEILTSMEQSNQRLHFSDEEVRRQLFKGKHATMSPASRLAVLASYANFVPGSYREAPTHMSGFGGNDALFVQAFGRNMFEDKDLTSEIVEKRQVLGSDEAMFAHLDMLVRGETILKKLGVVADPVFADIPFDADSAQAQTRNSKEWVKREALTRVHHVVTNHVRF